MQTRNIKTHGLKWKWQTNLIKFALSVNQEILCQIYRKFALKKFILNSQKSNGIQYLTEKRKKRDENSVWPLANV